MPLLHHHENAVQSGACVVLQFSCLSQLKPKCFEHGGATAKAICAIEVTLLSMMVSVSSLLSPAFAARSRSAAVEWTRELASLFGSAMVLKLTKEKVIKTLSCTNFSQNLLLEKQVKHNCCEGCPVYRCALV